MHRFSYLIESYSHACMDKVRSNDCQQFCGNDLILKLFSNFEAGSILFIISLKFRITASNFSSFLLFQCFFFFVGWFPFTTLFYNFHIAAR